MCHIGERTLCRRATIWIFRPYFLDDLEYEVRNSYAHCLKLRQSFRLNYLPLLTGQNWARGGSSRVALGGISP